jgi:hypothetical protein
MENDNDVPENELDEGQSAEAEGGQVDDAQAAAGVEQADDSGAGADGSSGEADAGPKSLAEALTAGIDSVANKGKEKGKEADADGKDGEGATDKEGTEKKDAADGEKKEGEEKPDDKAAKDGKQPDHVNDPIDARLAPRTQERIRSLADEVKQLRQISENNGAMIGAIMDTGASPQEFGAMVGYLGAVHSEDPARLEAAYQLLQSELQGLAIRMGKPLPEVNWLDGQQDLIDGIRAGAMTRETAIELAMHRASKKRNDAVTAAKVKDAQATQSTEQEAKAASAELDALGDELAAADPQYAAKYAIIVPKLKAEMAKLPPKQWKTRFLEEYAKTKIVSKTAPVAAAAPVINKPKNQPLRPSTPSGGTVKAPGSALDALSSAIDGMRN